MALASKQVLQFEKVLAGNLLDSEKRTKISQIIGGTSIENRERVQLVAQQRIEISRFAELVVLPDDAQEETMISILLISSVVSRLAVSRRCSGLTMMHQSQTYAIKSIGICAIGSGTPLV